MFWAEDCTLSVQSSAAIKNRCEEKVGLDFIAVEACWLTFAGQSGIGPITQNQKYGAQLQDIYRITGVFYKIPL